LRGPLELPERELPELPDALIPSEPRLDEPDIPEDSVELGEPDMPPRPPRPLWPERLTSPSSSSERDDARIAPDDAPSPGDASSRMPLRCDAERDWSLPLDRFDCPIDPPVTELPLRPPCDPSDAPCDPAKSAPVGLDCRSECCELEPRDDDALRPSRSRSDELEEFLSRSVMMSYLRSGEPANRSENRSDRAPAGRRRGGISSAICLREHTTPASRARAHDGRCFA
jgi:hypothetical protein